MTYYQNVALNRMRRKAVSVTFAWKNLCDRTLWIYSAERDNLGLDPWTEITGVDKGLGALDGKWMLDYGRTGQLIVDGDYQVFAQTRDLDKIV